MALDFVMMVLLTVAAFVVVAVLSHSPATSQFSAAWVSAAMLAAIMVLTFFKTIFLLAVMHNTTTLLELLTGQKTRFPPRIELVGTVQRMHNVLKELTYHGPVCQYCGAAMEGNTCSKCGMAILRYHDD